MLRNIPPVYFNIFRWIWGSKSKSVTRNQSALPQTTASTAPKESESTAQITQSLTASQPQTSDMVPKNADLDELSTYKEELAKKIETYQKQLKQWEDERSALLGQTLVPHEVGLPESSNMNSLKAIFAEIKGLVEPASWDLADLYNREKDNIEQYSKSLDDACLQLRDLLKQSPTQEKQKQLSLELCEKNIALLRELLALANNILRELDYCSSMEQIEKKGIVDLTLLVVKALLAPTGKIGEVLLSGVLAATQSILPDPNSKNNPVDEKYHDFLYHEIYKQLTLLGRLIVTAEIEIMKAMTVLKENQNQKTYPVSQDSALIQSNSIFNSNKHPLSTESAPEKDPEAYKRYRRNTCAI